MKPLEIAFEMALAHVGARTVAGRAAEILAQN
jgi:hypothetical protein